jgi:hypothetical protein
LRRSDDAKQGSHTVAMIMLLATAAWAGNQASVHTFCSQPACADGAYPYAGMIFDSAGNL